MEMEGLLQQLEQLATKHRTNNLHKTNSHFCILSHISSLQILQLSCLNQGHQNQNCVRHFLCHQGNL